MKLKKMEFTVAHMKKGAAPAIRVTKGGVFSFNKGLSEHLKLNAGTGVDFFQDEEVPRDWYIKLSEKSQNKVRRKEPSKGYLFNNAGLAGAFLTSIDAIDDSKSFKVATVPEKVGKEFYYAILIGLPE